MKTLFFKIKTNKIQIKNFLIIFVIVFNLVLTSCSSIYKNNNKDSIQKNVLFAEIKENGFEFKFDTLKYKNDISTSIFSADSKIKYDKVEIVKHYTLGENKDSFFYVMLSDFSSKVKTCRWLVKNGESLYLNLEVKKNNENFELIYLTCVGDQNCNPNVYTMEGKRVWLCGDNPNCLINGETRIGCTSYTTFIAP